MIFLGRYIRAVYTDWIASVSGSASVVLYVLAQFWWKSEVPRYAFYVTAIICFLIANFRVWLKAYLGILEEREKRYAPQLVLDFEFVYRHDPTDQPFLLSNRGPADAFRIKIGDVVYGHAKATFPAEIPRLAAGAEVSIIPDNVDGPNVPRGQRWIKFWIQDLFLRHSKQETISIPVEITYADIYGAEFVTECVLEYDGTTQRAVVHVKRHVLRRSKNREAA